MKFFLVVMSFLFLFWSMYMFLKSLKNKRIALFIVPSTMAFKFLLIIVSVVATIVNYPNSIYFSPFFISLIISVFSIDIVIVEDGIAYGAKFLAWNKIDKLSIDSMFFTIQTKSNLSDKRFIRYVWKVDNKLFNEIQKFAEKNLSNR